MKPNSKNKKIHDHRPAFKKIEHTIWNITFIHIALAMLTPFTIPLVFFNMLPNKNTGDALFLVIAMFLCLIPILTLAIIISHFVQKINEAYNNVPRFKTH